jgi:hypothetical protein
MSAYLLHILIQLIGGYQIGKWVYKAVDAFLLYRKETAWNHSERDGGWYD